MLHTVAHITLYVKFISPTAGRKDVPCYDRWYKWTKFSLNAASVVLSWGVLIVREGEISEQGAVNALYVFIMLLRTAEVVKDTVPLVRLLHIICRT